MALGMRLLDANPRLSGHWGTRQTALTSFDWSITAYSESDRERAIEAKGRCKKLIEQLLTFHTDTVAHGVSALELDWQTGTEHGTAPRLMRRYFPVELEKWDHDPMNIRILSSDPKPIRKQIGSPSPANWIADVDTRYQRGGLLRPLARSQVLQADNMLEWSNFNRKLKGLIQAIYNDVDDAEKDTAVQAVRTFLDNNFATTSDGIDIKFHSMTDGKGNGSFKALIDDLKSDDAIAILGQANTSQLPSGGGSRAALQILNLIRADIYYSDMTRMERIINLLLTYDFQFNGGDPLAESAPWYFGFTIEEEQDPESRARIIVDYVNAGIPVVEEDAYLKPGLTVPTPESKLLSVTKANPLAM